MKTLIGIGTFGNLEFTKIAVRSIRETVDRDVAVAIIVGSPSDRETEEWAMAERRRGVVRYVGAHHRNLGFCWTCNDLIDLANDNFDALIIMGNDVVAYPNAINSMIDLAESGKWDCISASQFDAKSLVDRYPEVRSLFVGPNLIFSDFNARPWEVHRDFRPYGIQKNAMRDVQNLTLFRRRAFESVGYFDPNFWPNGYFSDNDMCRRLHLAGVASCTLDHAAFFHFWSRTIHQGAARPNDKYFCRNADFYSLKWGGGVDAERWNLPFDGTAYNLCPGVVLPPTLKIERNSDSAIVDHWSFI